MENKGKYEKSTIEVTTEILKLMTSKNFFVHKQMYLQTAGAPIGSPLSTILAEIVVQHIEQEVLHIKNQQKPFLFKRYVDDIIIIWQHNLEELHELKGRLSSIYNEMQYTLEIEKEGKIPFLDIMLYNKQDHIEYSTYRKPTYIPTIIPAKSSHPMHHKLAAFRSFINRAYNHSYNSKYLKEELKWIKKLAAENGYKDGTIQKLIRNLKPDKPKHKLVGEEKVKKKYIGSLPYIPKIVSTVKNICKKHNMDIGVKVKTIGNMIINDRDQIPPLNTAGVYRIPTMLCLFVF